MKLDVPSQRFLRSEFVLLAIISASFFRFIYPYHLRFAEMYQLFEFTGEYLVDTISIPGGLSDYFGRFLTQLYLFPVAGAVINAILISVTCICFIIPQEKISPVSASLGLIPAFCTWIFLLSENALIGGVIALLLATLIGEAVHRIHSPRLRAACIPASLPLVYMFCGPMAIVFAIMAARREKIRIWVITASVAVILPYAARHIFECPEANLWAGVHVCRYRNILPVWLWCAAGSMVLAPIAGRLELKKPSSLMKTVWGIFSAAVITGTASISIISHTDSGREETMKYAFMALQNDWDGIVSTAGKSAPKSRTAIKCVNLALGMRGELGDKMFHFPQEGPECLIPDVSTDFVAQITTAEVFRQLGMVNTAKHFVFEAQEGLPDFQKSGICYSRLAETNLQSGKKEVAFKYSEALKNTLFHKKWAGDFEESVITPVNGDYSDEFFNHRMIKSILGLEYASSKGQNRLALDYLLACSLLEKDLDFFGQYLPLAGEIVMPASWNEASLLRRSLSGEDIQELQEFRKGPTSRFSNTYWSYFFFRYYGADR